MKKMIIVLTVVTLISGFLLSFVYKYFLPRILYNKEVALNQSLNYVLPEAKKFEKLTTDKYSIYKGLDSNGNIVGYAFLTKGGGYQGDIVLLISITPDLKHIIKINVLEQVETPGLGARIEEDWFKKQFEGLSITEPITYVKNKEPDKNKNQIKAISGATISSRSVVRIVNDSLKDVVKIIKNIK